MKRLLALVVTLAALAFPASASATYSGSCYWSTAYYVWHYSPAYSVFYEYTGHQMLGGKNYRRFITSYRYPNGPFDNWYVYCG